MLACKLFSIYALCIGLCVGAGPPQEACLPLRNSTPSRRALSVKSSPRPGEAGPWPVCQWPNGVVMQAVRFRWANDRSRQRLEPLVRDAMEKWRPALYPHSALAFVLDDQHLDALTISDATTTGTAQAGGHGSTTTLGYEHQGRHRMQIVGTQDHYTPEERARLVLSIAHELGLYRRLHEDVLY